MFHWVMQGSFIMAPGLTCPKACESPWWLRCNAGDLGSVPGSERSAGEGNSKPLRYSCLENSMDRRAWKSRRAGYSPRGCKELDLTETLSHTHTHMWDPSFLTRYGTHVPRIARQIPKHWTTREVPGVVFNNPGERGLLTGHTVSSPSTQAFSISQQ